MPKLTDPGEWALIREIYFEGHEPKKDDIPPLERWDRLKRKRTKNQAR